MTITIELTPDVEAVLRRRARQQGRTAETVAGEILRQELLAGSPQASASAERPAPGESAAEALQEFIGIFHSGKGDLSRNTGEQYTEHLLQKRRQGHL